VNQGRVFIVGAGPGDPGLLTLAAAKALAEADVVLYDALASPAVLRHARPGADVRYVGKRSRDHAYPQAELTELLVSLARGGKKVVRLKGGDPFIYGRGGEEARACREAGVPYTVIPGITSAIAAPAYAGIPLTYRGLAEHFLVVTGHTADPLRTPDWELAARVHTLVILMGVETFASIAEALIAAGKDPETPAAAVRWGTRPDQQVVLATIGTLAEEMAGARLESPAVIVVGVVASLARELAWFTPGPLAGRRIVVTRARSQSSDLAAALEALGAYVVEAPVIGICSNASDTALQDAVSSHPDWLLFTSANAVAATFEALQARSLDARALAGAKLAAVGTATAHALRERGLVADFVPSKATSEALTAELPIERGEVAVLPASSLTGESVAAALRARGAAVTQVVAYTNVPQPLDAQQRREVLEADVITFTSASTARNLREALEGTPLAASTRLVSIGPQTSAAVIEAFGHVDREASSPALESLIEAVQAVLQ
jgi:uroporphyrinogen III methyltransferase/synthase